MDFDKAQEIFLRSFKEEKLDKSLEYVIYIFLIKSNYKELAHIFRNNGNPGAEPFTGFSLYSLYWYKFMTGELDELQEILYRMLSDSNYFIRVFAIKELFSQKKLGDPIDLIKKKIKFYELSYEFPMEEQRASLYLDFLNKDYHLAMETGLSLLKEYPKVSEVYIDFIEFCTKSGNSSCIGDIISHESFLKLSETDYRLMYIHSRELYKTGKLDESKEILERLIEIFKHNPIFHYNLGNIYFSRGKLLKAADSFEESVSLAPLFERSYYNLGCVYFQLRDMKSAIKNFEEAVRISKKPDALYNLSICLIENKDLRDAYFYLNKIPSWYSPKCPPSEIKQQIKELVVFT
jgi:tetratricopeptide (TPR) repeat protein